MKALTHILLVYGAVLVTSAHAQPWTPRVIWERNGAADSSLYGTSVLALGDQNGDSYAEWAVFASGWGPPGQPNEPKVEFFHGGNPPDTVPYMVRITQTPEEEYLWGARTLDDLNGDSYVDWAVITEYASDSLDRDVYKIYFGGPGSHTVPDLVFVAPWFSGYRGIGDFNGDGFDDLALNDQQHGQMSVYFGGNPMDTIADWACYTCLGVVSSGDLNHDGYSDLATYENPGIGLYFGSSHPDTLADACWLQWVEIPRIVPDFNGDGNDDLCVDDFTQIRVIFGSGVMDSTTNARLRFGGCAEDGATQISGAGDINRDGYNDLVAYGGCSDGGSGLCVYLGHPWLNSEAAFVIAGGSAPTHLVGIRSSVALGDVNGDSIDDLGIGANDPSLFAGWRGRAVILSGDTTLRAATDEPRALHPSTFLLSAYPNPFNGRCTVALTVPWHTEMVDLVLYNLLGQKVYQAQVLPSGGRLTYSLDGSSLTSGLYILRASAGSLRTTAKLMVLK